MTHLITALHPYNVGHVLTAGDVKTIDHDRVDNVRLRATLQVTRESRYEILELLETCVNYITNQFVEEPDLVPDFILNATRIIERFKPS